MAVYFEPRSKHWTEYVAPVAGELLSGLIGNMFERDRKARETKDAENRGRMLQSMFHQQAEPVSSTQATPVPSTQAMPVPSTQAMPEINFDYGGMNSLASANNAPLDVGAMFGRIGDDPNMLRALGSMGVKDLTDLFGFSEQQRLQGRREGLAAPAIDDRQGTANYFADMARFASDPNVMRVIGEQMRHMTPHKQFGSLNLGDKQEVYSLDPLSGAANTEMQRNVSVSPDVSAREAGANYRTNVGASRERAGDWYITQNAEGELIRVNKVTGVVAPLGVAGKPVTRAMTGGQTLNALKAELRSIHDKNKYLDYVKDYPDEDKQRIREIEGAMRELSQQGTYMSPKSQDVKQNNVVSPDYLPAVPQQNSGGKMRSAKLKEWADLNGLTVEQAKQEAARQGITVIG